MVSNEAMDLGQLDFCLRVANAEISKDFYQDLGFQVAEGNAVDGWVVLERRGVRLGLFEEEFMGEDVFSLNFRNGDIQAVVDGMESAGREPSKGPRFSERGSMVQYRDPDGFLVFFDSVSN